MTLAYLPRLLCIALAAFVLIHLALATAVLLVARRAVRLADRWRPRAAARAMFTLRLLPAVCAATIVLLACVPSYFRLEPETAAEHVGYVCLAAALLGLGLWARSLRRGLRAVADSRRFLEAQKSAPLLALAGIIRPRLVISHHVVSALTPEQLAVALRHERAHWTARDNLKRLCILLAPPGVPFSRDGETLERAWRKYAEWAADDRAVGGSERRSMALAEALVRIARMTPGPPPSPLAVSLLGDDQQFAARVERLLRAPSAEDTPCRRLTLPLSAALVIACALVALLLQPATLYAVHVLLERLIE